MNEIKNPEQYTDVEIVVNILQGETALYEMIIRRYNTYLYKTGRSYGYSHGDTEDLMQEAYISAYTNLAKFENRSSFKTWLIKIMLNHCYHKKRKFNFTKEIPLADLPQNVAPMFTNKNADTLNKELGKILENALQQLPENYRIVFSLRELSNMSTTETSEVLGISGSNVKVRLNRAKSLLRNQIEKMYSPADIFEFNLTYCDKMVEKVMKEIKISSI